jgi:ATP synthase F1 delta subunit
VFDPERWAEAFTGCTGKDVSRSLEFFRAFCMVFQESPAFGEGPETGAPPVRGNAPRLGGSVAAKRLEAVLRSSLAEAGFAGSGSGALESGAEYALRFFCLLVKKDLFRYRMGLLQALERSVDRELGIVRIRVKSAAPLTADQERALKEKLLEKTGAKEVALRARIDPELLAGMKLYIGNDVYDSSLRARIRRMERDLTGGAARRGDG